jgi:hypothetical protein
VNTSDNQSKKRSPHPRHWARRSHRVVAIGAFSFLILVAITGLLLNHSDDLGLPQQHVSGALAKRLYGIEATAVGAAFEAAGLIYVTAADTVYAGDSPIADGAGEIRGAVLNNDLVVIATDREFILATRDAVVVERSEIAPTQQASRLGVAGSRVVVDTDAGRFAFDTNRMQLAALDPAIGEPAWSVAVELDDEQQQRLSNAAIGQIISWERVISDLHSGRILPGVGVYLFDITALCLLYLCMSGVLLWFRRR